VDRVVRAERVLGGEASGLADEETVDRDGDELFPEIVEPAEGIGEVSTETITLVRRGPGR
jgi:hypothetical protein